MLRLRAAVSTGTLKSLSTYSSGRYKLLSTYHWSVVGGTRVGALTKTFSEKPSYAHAALSVPIVQKRSHLQAQHTTRAPRTGGGTSRTEPLRICCCSASIRMPDRRGERYTRVTFALQHKRAASKSCGATASDSSCCPVR